LVGVGLSAGHRGAEGVPDALLDVDGLAARLGVTARFVRRLVEERRLPYLKIGRFVRFDPVEVERWVLASRIEPPEVSTGVISPRRSC
jgi:excisionase family DNA binding protein